MTGVSEAPRLAPPAPVESVAELSADLQSAIGRVIQGKDEVIRTAITVMLAGGHLLVQDVPGVGKTALARALGAAVAVQVKRIQFTPDLLPSDLTGVSIYNQETRDFEFKPGPVFTNILLGDEINRASPKTQSALLECMEEGRVTADGVTYPLATPFMVIATQNPVEMDGTFALPEAQLDRFMARLSMGYPSDEAAVAMLSVRQGTDPLAELSAVAGADQVRSALAGVEQVHTTASVQRYIVDLVSATRRHPAVRLGASPRAALHLVRAAQAAAAIERRGHVLPDDVQRLAPIVLSHRLLLSPQAAIDRRGGIDVVNEVLRSVPVHQRGM